MTEEIVKATPRHWTQTIDSALLVLLLSAAAYAIAFEYQAGYLSYFGVPEILCEVSLRELVISGAAVLGLLVSLFFIIYWLFGRLLAAVLPAVRFRLVYVTLLFFLFCFLAAYSSAPRPGKILGMGFAVILVLGELVVPLVTRRNLPTYAARLNASVRADVSRPGGSEVALARDLIAVFTPSIFVLLFVSVGAALVANTLGMRAASEQKTFLVAGDDSLCVVIAALSEGLLCVGFDARTHEALGVYHFIKPEGASIRLRQIGPLKAVMATPEASVPLPGAGNPPSRNPR